MPLDARFLAAVEPRRAPQMGTENVGLLLYALLRAARPVSVLEVGAG